MVSYQYSDSLLIVFGESIVIFTLYAGGRGICDVQERFSQ